MFPLKWVIGALILLALYLMLTGCTVVVGDYQQGVPSTPTTTVTADSRGVSCDPYAMPLIGSVPGLPVISDKTAKDRGKTEDILLKHIEDLRIHIREIKAEFEKSFEEQMKTCH